MCVADVGAYQRVVRFTLRRRLHGGFHARWYFLPVGPIRPLFFLPPYRVFPSRGMRLVFEQPQPAKSRKVVHIYNVALFISFIV